MDHLPAFAARTLGHDLWSGSRRTGVDPAPTRSRQSRAARNALRRRLASRTWIAQRIPGSRTS
jgi:hypothetical protein